MAKMKDLTGLKFNKLTVLEFAYKNTYKLENGNWIGKYYWKCQCDCGNIIIVRSDELKANKYKSCGCDNVPYNVINLAGQRFR